MKWRPDIFYESVASELRCTINVKYIPYFKDFVQKCKITEQL